MKFGLKRAIDLVLKIQNMTKVASEKK